MLPVERIALMLLFAAGPAWAFDAGGASLGDSEAAVMKAYPRARCQRMGWETDAADRRCDAAPARFGGIEARITFYLRRGAVQAFDVRFEDKDLRAAVAYLKERYGKPDFEGRETFRRRGDAREIYKLRWARGEDRAVLSSMAARRRVELNVWRGNFDTEIYRVR
jgi:hypothetical protein